MSLRATGGSTQIQWRACASKYKIGDLALYSGLIPIDTKHQPALWKVTGADGATATTVTLGQTPPGFRRDVPFTSVLQPNQTYTLLANVTTNSVYGRVTFKPSQLTQGVVVFENDRVKTVDAYDHLSNQDFGCK